MELRRLGLMPRPPWSNLHAQIHRGLRGRSLLPQGCGVVVAVSGGQDSIALLKLLVDLQPKWHWRLWAVHCDHRWRPDSADNAAFVADLCQSWNIPCQVMTAETCPTTEADARQWRYQVLGDAAQSLGATHIATGHTATDRAETLLYNLLRGSGTDGLQALAWQRPLSSDQPELTVVRPLLDLTRQDTAQFCQQFNLPVWIDSTNADLTYARNRLRLEVFPLLQRHFNPRVDQTLAQTAEILTAEVALLDLMAEALYTKTVQRQDLAWVIQRSGLRSAPLALQRRVLRRALQRVMTAPVTFDHGEKLVALIAAPNRSQTDPFPGGWLARVEADQIWLIHAGPSPQTTA